MTKVTVPKPKAIVLDMDGTTIPFSYFAQKVLPYIKESIKPFIIKNRDDKLIRELIDDLREELKNDDNAPTIPRAGDGNNNNSDEQVFRAVVAGVTYIIHERVRSGVFLNFLTLISLDGYQNGHLKGNVFDDVPDALYTWKKRFNIHPYIFSSGCVEAQQMHFHCSTAGNLDPLIDGYLTGQDVGSKKEAKTWPVVAQKINAKIRDIIFVTDDPSEARGASSAGVRAILITRPNNPKFVDKDKDTFPVINSLLDMDFN